jgi:hypothetical protein
MSTQGAPLAVVISILKQVFEADEHLPNCDAAEFTDEPPPAGCNCGLYDALELMDLVERPENWKPKLTMRRGDEHHPGTVMKAAKRAAIEAGWLLETWATFAKRAYACLDPEASSEALSRFHAVVREYFDVTT